MLSVAIFRYRASHIDILAKTKKQTGIGHSLGCDTFSSLHTLHFTGLTFMVNIH